VNRYCVGPARAVDWGEGEPPVQDRPKMTRRVLTYFRPYRRPGLAAGRGASSAPRPQAPQPLQSRQRPLQPASASLWAAPPQWPEVGVPRSGALHLAAHRETGDN
jgi:hypothetical protein